MFRGTAWHEEDDLVGVRAGDARTDCVVWHRSRAVTHHRETTGLRWGPREGHVAVVDEYGSDAERKVLVFNPFVGLKPQSAKFFCNLDGYGRVGARTVDCRMEKSEEEGCDQCETRGGEPWAAPGYDRTMRRAPDDKDDPERRYNDAEGESAVHQWPHH